MRNYRDMLLEEFLLEMSPDDITGGLSPAESADFQRLEDEEAEGIISEKDKKTLAALRKKQKASGESRIQKPGTFEDKQKRDIEMRKADEALHKKAKEDGSKKAKKDFFTKKNAAIAGGAAVGAAGAAVGTTSAIKLAKLKKNAKALYADYRSKGGKDSFDVWYKKKKAALIAGTVGGGLAAGAGATGAILAKKKLQEAYDIAYLEAYYDEMQALEEAFYGIDEDELY